MNFDSAAIAVLENQGHKPRTPDALVEWWSNFVDQCVEGYDWTIYEFDDELAVRDYIKCLLGSSPLANFDEFAEFSERIALLDSKYKTLLQDNVKRPSNSDDWWRVGVLKYAGTEYCEDIKSRYSIDVEEYEED